MKKTWTIKMDNKIQELVRLYHKDFEATDGFAAVLFDLHLKTTKSSV